MMIAVAAFGIEAAAFRDCFEQRRLAAAVLADEERHPTAEFYIDALGERPEVEGKARRVPFLGIIDDVPEERPRRCRQADASRALSAHRELPPCNARADYHSFRRFHAAFS